MINIYILQRHLQETTYEIMQFFSTADKLKNTVYIF